MKNIFRIVAGHTSNLAGSAGVFFLAVMTVVVWAATGPMFGFSDTWQLVINTGTTIVTFLMVFLIQNTQNRDGKAVQIKLDELIRATKGARQYYMGLEDLTDDELAELDRQIKEIAARPSSAKAIQKLQQTIAAEHAQRRGRLQMPHLPHLPLTRPAAKDDAKSAGKPTL